MSNDALRVDLTSTQQTTQGRTQQSGQPPALEQIHQGVAPEQHQALEERTAAQELEV